MTRFVFPYACLRQYRRKMEGLIEKTGSYEGSVLTAATNGDIEFFRAVVTCLKEHLTSEQVRVNQPYRCVGLNISDTHVSGNTFEGELALHPNIVAIQYLFRC